MAWEAGVDAQWQLVLHDGGQDLAVHVVVDQADPLSVVAGGGGCVGVAGSSGEHSLSWSWKIVTLVEFVQRLLHG